MDLCLRWKTVQKLQLNNTYKDIQVHECFEALSCFHLLLPREGRAEVEQTALALFVVSLGSWMLPRSL